MYGTTWCQDCKRAKQFFGEHRVRYALVDVDQDPDGLRVVEKFNDGKRFIPTIVFADGAVLVEPSNVALETRSARKRCSWPQARPIGGWESRAKMTSSAPVSTSALPATGRSIAVRRCWWS